ncbi:hypothetical protein AgCh_008787 [Apium graveolens]
MTYVGNEEKYVVMPHQQKGFIKIRSDRGVQSVYEYDGSDKNREPITHGDELDIKLKGPTFCYSKHIYMEYDFFCGDYKDRKCIGWRPRGNAAFSAQLRLESKDCGREIVIILGCFANATVATVEVTLSGISVASKIYGVVATNNSKLDTPNCTSLLFVKKPHNVV